ncbi:uncharacterized protein [Arachis hypogaea]|uniref:uncharacterized protein n=1 Tax=Arachis hypogaea TaxID=3818 RepID=UPI003B21CE4A
MKILSWNCRGLGNPWAIRALNKLIKQKAPNLVFLMETRKKSEEIMRLRYKGEMQNVVGVDYNGDGRQRGGGLAVLWNREIDVNITSMSKNHIDMVIQARGSNHKWRATEFYGWPENQNKQASWELLRSLGQASAMPWVVFGDFNQVLNQHEKLGGNPITYAQAGSNNIQERLDRAMANLGWKETFPETTIQHLTRYKSDHCPILLDLYGDSKRRKKSQHRFRFEEMWLTNEDCDRIVEEAWNERIGTVKEKINLCGERLDSWGRRTFGDIPKRIKKAEKALEQLNSLPQNEETLRRTRMEEEELDDLIRMEEI